MLKRYILICTLLSSAAAFASKPLDSIGVENNNGKKLIIHKVDPKESYYSISRKYNVNVKDVQAYNNNAALQIGSIVKVPTEIPFNQKATTSVPTITANSFFDYTVVAKDNLNLIAERFATTVADIKKLNNLSGNNLQVGQVLRVPFNKTNPLATNTATPQTSNQPQETKTVPTTTGVIEHIVKPKEYLGVIAKQYEVTVEEIKELNGLNSNNLQIGQVLKIPAKGAAAQNEAPVIASKPIESKPVESKPVESKPTAAVSTPAPSKTDPTFEHVVAANETIYSIAQKYQLTTYQLKTFNNLTSNDLTVGQKLIIKGEKPAPTVSTANNNDNDDESTESTGTLKNPNLKRPAATYGLNRIEEKGTGVWITDADLDPNKMLILHRTAPVGTIIQITNPMTNRSTFAKVVGKFTENETTKDVIIVMTKAVADAVGALDKRFFCTLTYGPKENEN
ncbi:LysM peptidoglycan-binding domain-containing protein [Pedobacter chitinilyticus]|uniref:LysM peptidoglycan-binding domain-containing protein n=1 Tax=Pedobacter chitinilyticus TaxID=2233776 RepID=A0A3S3Q0S9_9SPHI|nr:LysM peptidoglycan-binding domain-containing protein [Pedobacter chitinilyticus]RWU10282.1 LysM peptidoglycan-binding domain-containing protein [Pedobacter chitinilyticus]